jgi:signal transduction histidine kinase
MFVNIPRKKFSILSQLFFVLGTLVVLLLGSIIYSYYISQKLSRQNALAERTASVVAQLDLLEKRLDNCVLRVQAFAESDKTHFLFEYEKDRDKIYEDLEVLAGISGDDVPVGEQIPQLRNLLKSRFNLLEKAIRIYRGEEADKKGQEERRKQATQVRTKINDIITELKNITQAALDEQKQEARSQLLLNRLVNQIMIVLGGVLAGMLAIVALKDIREREKTEQQLRLLNNQKSQFFSIISHDLRGPTRNTTLLLEMMDDSTYVSSPEESKKMAGLALESARQTQKLVEDLLAWGRLQMDQVNIQTTRFRPHEVAENVCRALQPAAVLKGISLENHIPADLLIQADSNMVETVIRNLVSNAIKFTPQSGKVRIIAQPRGAFVELTVEDSGVGMSPEVVAKIFSFHTKHSTKGTAGEPGTGLGLALCREFVERNGGAIGVESQPGQGSRFNVRLPAA